MISVQDFSPLYKVFSKEDNDQGNLIFLYSLFGFITKEYNAYFGKSKLRKFNLTPKDIRESLELLPDKNVYPKAPSNITNFVISISSNVFIKGLKLHLDFQGTGLLSKLILQKVEIMELLMYKPHLNIIHYYNCLIKCGYIVGIVLNQYFITLKKRLENVI